MRDALLSQPIVLLNDSHDRRAFYCGIEALDGYFQLSAPARPEFSALDSQQFDANAN
jgi:hypothetical protein